MAKGDAFTKSHFDWLDQVLGDIKEVGEDGFVAGYVLKCKHENRKTGRTDPSFATLASTLGKSERRAMAAVGKLVTRGHLERDRGGKGRSNRYRFVFFDMTKVSDDHGTRPDETVTSKRGRKRPVKGAMTGHFCPDDLTKVSKSTGRKRHTNHLKEPSEEPYNSESVKRAATEFDEWYRHYPRKVARGAAEKAYRTARKEVSADVLLAGVLQYAAQRQGKNPEYTPYPATWLNSRRWTDEPPAPSQQMSILEIVQSAVSNADQLFRNDDTPGILDLDAEELP